MKKVIIPIFLLFFLFAIFIYWRFLKGKTGSDGEIACTMEAKICSDGTAVGRDVPDCEFAPCPGEVEGIKVSLPKEKEEVSNPLKIEGEAKGPWFFEAQFNAELFDSQGIKLGSGILTAKEDWMSEDYVPFAGSINFLRPSSSVGILRFLSSNPSGLPENQKQYEMTVRFSDKSVRNVLLYYYNPELDKDSSGNIKCSRDGLVSIERDIPRTQTPIKDTINLLLKGDTNIDPAEKTKGITTEFPLENFTLTEVNLKSDGNLILKFSDPQNESSGGSCRAGILWFQIEATAKQFPEVKSVEFTPEELFQP